MRCQRCVYECNLVCSQNAVLQRASQRDARLTSFGGVRGPSVVWLVTAFSRAHAVYVCRPIAWRANYAYAQAGRVLSKIRLSVLCDLYTYPVEYSLH